MSGHRFAKISIQTSVLSLLVREETIVRSGVIYLLVMSKLEQIWRWAGLSGPLRSALAQAKWCI